MLGFCLAFKDWCWMQLANVKALVDARHLQSALPLLQIGRVKVPLMLHVAQVIVLNHSCFAPAAEVHAGCVLQT